MKTPYVWRDKVYYKFLPDHYAEYTLKDFIRARIGTIPKDTKQLAKIIGIPRESFTWLYCSRLNPIKPVILYKLAEVLECPIEILIELQRREVIERAAQKRAAPTLASGQAGKKSKRKAVVDSARANTMPCGRYVKPKNKSGKTIYRKINVQDDEPDYKITLLEDNKEALVYTVEE